MIAREGAGHTSERSASGRRGREGRGKPSSLRGVCTDVLGDWQGRAAERAEGWDSGERARGGRRESRRG